MQDKTPEEILTELGLQPHLDSRYIDAMYIYAQQVAEKRIDWEAIKRDWLDDDRIAHAEEILNWFKRANNQTNLKPKAMTEMEEILYKHLGSVSLTNREAVKAGMVAAMKAWGDKRFEEGRDKALDWAANNVIYKKTGIDDRGFDEYEINYDSITAGKTHPDLLP